MSSHSLNRPAAPALYRATTLGRTLQSSLNQLKTEHELDDAQIKEAMLVFDTAIYAALAERATNTVSLSGHLDVYRHCDNIWTLIVDHATVLGTDGAIQSDAMKFVAPEARGVPTATKR